MAKQKASKKKEVATKVDNLSGVFIHPDELYDWLPPLIERAKGGVDSEPEGSIARMELERLVFDIVGEAMEWAREGGKDVRNARRNLWAGEFLAELLTVLEKRVDWVAANSRAFKDRRAKLSRLRDLQAKPSGLSACMGYVLEVYRRVIEIMNTTFWQDIWQDVAGLVPSEHPPLSNLERKVPAILEEIEKQGADTETAWFNRVIWPLLCERKSEIMADKRIKLRLADERKRRLLRKDSFSTIQSDFRKSWRTLYRKPVGRLLGIERERVL